MLGAGTFYGTVNEDGSFSVLARAVSLEGTGETVRDEEGPCLIPDDVASITCKVYDIGSTRNATTGVEITPAPTLTPASNLYDELQKAGWDVGMDPHGYNFRHDVSPTYCPSPNNWYYLEYKITLTGGGVVWLKGRVKTAGVFQS